MLPVMADEEGAPPPPHYGIALLGIVLAIVMSAVADEGGPLGVLALLVQGAVLVFVLTTSDVGRRLRLGAIVVTLVALCLGVASVLFSDGQATGFGAAIAVLLAVATPVAIVRRLIGRDRVDVQTVAGALCIYLLFGLSFALVYRFVDVVSAQPFFAQVADPTQVDFTYFSFVTMTTVGYGDLTAASDAGRMLAITEALLGQVYLVTIVAFTISRLGRPRRTTGDARR